MTIAKNVFFDTNMTFFYEFPNKKSKIYLFIVQSNLKLFQLENWTESVPHNMKVQ